VLQTSSPRPNVRPATRRRAVALVSLYLGAGLVAAGLFLAYRVYVHHATFAAREFFFLGGIHAADDDIGFRLAPNRNGIAVLQDGVREPARRIAVRTNSSGFRVSLSDENPDEVSGGLAGIGCSCTFGHGVAAESTWVEVAATGLGLAAANLGVCAYSAVSSVELLRQHIDTLRPQLIVYAYGNFHLERSRQPRTDITVYQTYLTTRAAQPQRLRPQFNNRLIFALSPRIEAEYYTAKLENRSLRFDLDKLGLLLPLALQDLQRTLHPATVRARFAPPPALSDTALARWVTSELVAMAQTCGAHVAILFFPAFHGEQPSPGLMHVLGTLAGAEELFFVDVGPRLFAQVLDQHEYSAHFQIPRDGHPNAAMHREMGVAVVEAALAHAHTHLGAGAQRARAPDLDEIEQ